MTETRDLPTEERDRPRYKEVISALLEDILQQRYATGERLPTEIELCERFGVSRHTVREALRRLQDMGYVKRRQGMGTVLVSQQGAGQFVNSISHLEQLLQYASSTRLEILSIDRILLQSEQAQRLHCRSGSEWFRVNALRRATPGSEAGSEPVCYSEIYVDPDYGDILDQIGAEPRAVYAMIEQRYDVRIKEVKQEIAASTADLNVASRLMVPLHAAVLVITRRYFSEQGRLVEMSVNTHPSDRFRYEMTLQRNHL
ncbi:GntR family transcriptional regulator [Algihabitans albus]|uniref:GntR family transcriptional regulator n=1 Tax=Algihabitans albus TaxID=2164067 RepID=UPI000E5D8603|nr:GntR family transcriptional regulator [Algihabitans albus]